MNQKSSCLSQLNVNPDADMDVALGIRHSPPLTDALNWLTGASYPIVVVSNHEEMLKSLLAAKQSGECSDQISAIYFLYLCKPKQRLQRHLQRPTAGGSRRPANDQNYTLNNYDRLHNLFAALADETIDCSTTSILEVSQQVLLVAKAVIAG